jgi:competence protein ComEC
MEILCFYAGMIFYYVNHYYSLLFVGLAFYFRPKKSYFIWFIAAMGYSYLHHWWVMPRGIPKMPIIQKALLTGKIISIPVKEGESVKFTFSAETMNGKPVTTSMSLTCYQHCPTLHAGEHWQLQAKLKIPRNLGNPGGFDFVNWLQSRHIDWMGTVQRGSFIALTDKNTGSWLLRLRESLCEKLARLNPDENTLGVLQALTIGVNSAIPKKEWELFRRTGTIHLIDISGAHIGLLTGISFYILVGFWSRLGKASLYCPAQKVAGLFAWLVAFAYTFLSGFALPAQRALMGCTFMILRYFLNQRFSVWRAWRYALLTVLLLEPHSVWMMGLYLSFFGVAILILVNQSVTLSGLRKIFILQLGCLVGLMPLTLFWFSYGAVSGLIANMFAIPLVELWIVPLGLVITFMPDGSMISIAMVILQGSITLLLDLLKWVDALSFINLTLSFNSILSPIALMVALCVLLFLRLNVLILPACIMGVAALLPFHKKLKTGQAEIDVMDVGQGLSVVVRTANHVLIYDTGIQFYKGSDMAKMAIIPYMKTLGVKKIDKLVISHPDLDHRGGLKSLEENYAVNELIVDSPAFYHRGVSCHDYPTWEWDDVSFRFFALKLDSKQTNNHSCILQISTASGKFLLTGDIEKSAEADLVATYGKALASTFLLIPHHASKTSSSALFIQTVSPQYAIASYGFDNRYHFPHLQALQNYENNHIPVLDTVGCGMISVKLDGSKDLKKPLVIANTQCHL